MAAVEEKEQRFVTVDDLVAEIQKQLNRAGAPFSHELLQLLAEFRVKHMGLKEFCGKVRLLIGAPVLMSTVKASRRPRSPRPGARMPADAGGDCRRAFLCWVGSLPSCSSCTPR